MRRALAAVAAATALACGLAACNGDAGAGPTPERPTTSESETDTSTAPTDPTESSPSSGPDEAPVLPDAAKQQTRAGAKAFVRHFVATLNFAWDSMQTRELRNLALAKCSPCSAGADAIDKVGEAGGSRRGGAWLTRTLTTLPSGEAGVTLVQLGAQTKAGQLRDSESAAPVRLQPRTVHLDIELVWRGSRWFVASMDVI